MRSDDVIAHGGACMWWEHKRKEEREEWKENAWSDNDGKPPQIRNQVL